MASKGLSKISFTGFFSTRILGELFMNIHRWRLLYIHISPDVHHQHVVVFYWMICCVLVDIVCSISLQDLFYHQVIVVYNKSHLLYKSDFIDTLKCQPPWGDRFLIYKAQNKCHTLYFKLWLDCLFCLKLQNVLTQESFKQIFAKPSKQIG